MRLAGTVVRILPENDDADVLEGDGIERVEDAFRRRIDRLGNVGAAHELRQFLEGGLLEFLRELSFPGFGETHVHSPPITAVSGACRQRAPPWPSAGGA